MASLIEELIETLHKENEIYHDLIPIANEKTQVIIDNNLEKLQQITDKEQEVVDHLTHLENQRMEVIKNMGVVLNKNPQTLTLKNLTEILKKQPKEQKELSEIHDQLKTTVQTLVVINNRNKALIEQSLQFIDFNMNYIQSTRMSPGNSYTKGAKQIESYMPMPGIFDAKQ